LLEQEAASHERVLGLLRHQRELLIGGRCEELGVVNRELLEAMEEATALSQARARAQRHGLARVGQGRLSPTPGDRGPDDPSREPGDPEAGRAAPDAGGPDGGGRALWGRLRHTSRLLRREAELNHSLAAEMLAQTEFSLDLLTGTSSYGADGLRRISGKGKGPDRRQGLLDQAA